MAAKIIILKFKEIIGTDLDQNVPAELRSREIFVLTVLLIHVIAFYKPSVSENNEFDHGAHSE